MMNHQYKLSFTVGDLFYQEAIKAAELYIELQDWAAVRSHILTENVFQCRTTATTGRILRELLPRLRSLSEPQLRILVIGNRQEQNQILWLAVCKQYQFIQEFAQEVIREKVYRHDPILCYGDFDSFFNAKAEWHIELAALTTRTRSELRRVLFQMLREAEILTNDHRILPVFLSPKVAQAMLMEDNNMVAFFPITETDFMRQVAI